MNLQPLQDFVVLKPKDVKLESTFGIILPEDIDEENNFAIVVSVGKEVTMDLKEGDVVLVKNHTVDEFMVDKVKYLIGRQNGIFAKVTE